MAGDSSWPTQGHRQGGAGDQEDHEDHEDYEDNGNIMDTFALVYYTRMEMLDIMMTIEEEEMTMWMARWRRAGWWR